MKNKISRFPALSLAVVAMLALLNAPPSTAVAQGTAFTYQGRLNDGVNPATGIYDVRFTVYDAATVGGVVAGPLTNAATGITNGLFTVTLDFGGGVFTGPARWLEISARTNGGGAFSTLAPRQPLTPTPYAIFAETANAAGLTGTIPAADLSGNYINPVTLNNAGNSFTGNGAGLVNVNAATLNGLSASKFWQIGGNAGTTPGVNFLGTTDNQELDLEVNDVLGLRVLPCSGNPSVVGGSANSVANDCWNTIIGGGTGNSVTNDTWYTVIGGGYGNQIAKLSPGWYPDKSVIGGGMNNTNAGYASVVPGGELNFAYGQHALAAGYCAKAMNNGTFVWADNNYANFSSTADNQFLIRASGGVGIGKNNPATALDVNGDVSAARLNIGASHTLTGSGASIAGGGNNTASGLQSFIGGGTINSATNSWSTVGGGAGNIAGGESAVVGGGFSNGALGQRSTVAGGADNHATSYYDTVAGGADNIASGGRSFVGGGTADYASGASSVVGGGGQNVVDGIHTNTSNFSDPGATFGFIGGGQNNAVYGQYGVVPGGQNNVAGDLYLGTFEFPGERDGTCSFAAGQNAWAFDDNCFVWSDGTGGTFESANTRTFIVRASNGVGINTNDPAGNALNVNGTVAASALRAPGAGVNTGTFAFIQRATGANTSGDYTVISNPLTDGNPNAILVITHNYSADTNSTTKYNTKPVGVYYTGSNWAIFNEDATSMALGRAFNVLVVKP
jgi:hypothetical protein